ncbi:MAG: hypothetical protein WBC92_15920 [Terracidiphilus sp.]
MGPHVSSPARYRLEDRILFVFVPLVFLFLIMQFSLSHFHLHPKGVWAVLCGAVASLPFIAAIFSAGLYLAEEKDEFQQSLCVQAILWGFGVTACVALVWLALGMFIHVPQMNFVSGVFLFELVFVVSFWVARWRYR